VAPSAADAVAVLVRALDDLLAPVLAHLDAADPTPHPDPVAALDP
jgi:hypothetical protein